MHVVGDIAFDGDFSFVEAETHGVIVVRWGAAVSAVIAVAEDHAYGNFNIAHVALVEDAAGARISLEFGRVCAVEFE